MKYLIFIWLIIQSTICYSQLTSKEAISLMGKGINMGNTLESPLEGQWGGFADEHLFDLYKEAGFKTIRIPIRWNLHTNNNSPYNIEQSWLDRIDSIINWGIKRDLFIIINAHHEDWLVDESLTDSELSRFDSIWSQISERFKNKSEKLFFEIINEPLNLTLNQVNLINKRVYDIIRKDNPTRIVLFSGNNWSNSYDMVLADIPDTNTNFLLAYYHSYDPYLFGQKGQGIWGSDDQRKRITNVFTEVKTWSEKVNVPVTLSEFGAVINADYNSRMCHYSWNVRQALINNVLPIAWDDNGQYQILIRKDSVWNDIKDVIINTFIESPDYLKLSYAPNQIKISWKNMSTDYNEILVQKRIKSNIGEFQTIAHIAGSDTLYVDTDVTDAEKYYYRLIAIMNDTLELYSYPQFINTTATTSYPFSGVPHELPGIIETENFDIGGQNLTYYDTDYENVFGIYRPNDRVDISGDDLNGYYIDSIKSSEWLKYQINFLTSGTYKVSISGKTAGEGGLVRLIYKNLETTSHYIKNVSNNQFDTYSSIDTILIQNTGVQTLTLSNVIVYSRYTIDRITFELINETGISEDSESNNKIIFYPNPADNFVKIVNSNEKIISIGIFNHNGCISILKVDANEYLLKIDDLKSGVYFVEITTLTNTITRKLIVNSKK